MEAAYEDWYNDNDDYQIEPMYECSDRFVVGQTSYTDSDDAIDEAIRTRHPVYSCSDIYFDPENDMGLLG